MMRVRRRTSRGTRTDLDEDWNGTSSSLSTTSSKEDRKRRGRRRGEESVTVLESINSLLVLIPTPFRTPNTSPNLSPSALTNRCLVFVSSLPLSFPAALPHDWSIALPVQAPSLPRRSHAPAPRSSSYLPSLLSYIAYKIALLQECVVYKYSTLLRYHPLGKQMSHKQK